MSVIGTWVGCAKRQTRVGTKNIVLDGGPHSLREGTPLWAFSLGSNRDESNWWDPCSEYLRRSKEGLQCKGFTEKEGFKLGVKVSCG